MTLVLDADSGDELVGDDLAYGQGAQIASVRFLHTSRPDIAEADATDTFFFDGGYYPQSHADEDFSRIYAAVQTETRDGASAQSREQRKPRRSGGARV